MLCWCVRFACVNIEGPRVCHVSVCLLCLCAVMAKMFVMLLCVFWLCVNCGSNCKSCWCVCFVCV